MAVAVVVLPLLICFAYFTVAPAIVAAHAICGRFRYFS
jgi:hypothetical protein